MFTIRCTTCQAGLAVKNEELVGQILACPKCGGMVLVEPPPESEPTGSATKSLAPENPPLFRTFPEAFISETKSGIINSEAREVSEEKTILNDNEPRSVNSRPAHPPEPPIAVSDFERKTRKMMLGFLAVLLILLVVALGALIALKDPSSPENQGLENELAAKKQPSVQLPASTSKSESLAESGETVKTIGLLSENPVEKFSENGADVLRSTPSLSAVEEPEKEEKDPVDSDLEIKSEIPSKEEGKKEYSSELQSRTRKSESREIQTPTDSTSDFLAGIQRKLPGLVESSAILTLDIPARLDLPLAELKLDQTPLISLIRLVSSMTEIPMTLDVDEMRCRGTRIDTPISGDFPAATVGETLTKLLAPLDLAPIVEDRQISVTVPLERRRRLLERRFDVSDLIRGTQKAVDLRGVSSPENALSTQRLVDILRRLVDPLGFSENPSPDIERPSIRIESETIVVRHELRKLDQSLRVLEQLRVLRGLEQTTPVAGADLVPEAFGWDAVQAPLTLNYYQPTSLAGVLQQIESATNLRILVDHQALHRALAPLNTLQGTVQSDEGTVNEALQRLLTSVDIAQLDYRIIGADLLEVSTWESIGQPEKMSIEIHRFETSDALLDDSESPESLVRTIRTALHSETWFDPENRGGARNETRGLGDIVIDRPSGCLLVRQSQPVQRQLRLWLGKKISRQERE